MNQQTQGLGQQRRLGVIFITAGLILALTPVTGYAAPAADSAVTVSGTGEFANLKISVSQTKNLISKTITVAWTGGKQTQPTTGTQVAADYLQIMQCWGDDAGGPRREQCQFGASYQDTRGGMFTNTRQVSYGSGLIDPAETQYRAAADAPAGELEFVPFKPVAGTTSSAHGFDTPYFDGNTTNEQPYARTRSDGTGQAFFEIQTAVEAPGLGCGESLATSGVTAGRSCWLVIVPRGETEVDDTAVSSRSPHFLDSSPLSTTNWNNHISVKLEFQPVSGLCAIGAHERALQGVEMSTEVVSRWSPALCSGGGTVFGFSEVTDATAWQQVLSEPKMVFTSASVPADRVPATRPLVYAPMSVSGLVIAFNIERQTPDLASDDVKQHDGERITELNLNARLVAKLLTQSYRRGVAYSATYLASNPEVLTADPEFKQLNPAFADMAVLPIADALMPLPQSQVAKVLWNWLNADPEARAFLNGDKDPWGMAVNRNYVNFIPVDDFPKNDLYCDNLPGGLIPWCTLDAHPYAANMHEAARAASRGDTLARNTYDPAAQFVVWKKGSPQPPGQRAILAVTDSATAARYGLPTAKLRNAAGTFVAATQTSMLAGVAAMKPGAVADVLEPDPKSTASGAYPLTTVTYAAVAPSALDATAAADYAAFLRYGVDSGQQPGDGIGQLPEGYAQLPATLRAQTLTAATKIVDLAGKAVVTSVPAAAGTGQVSSGAGAQNTAGGTSTTAGGTPTAAGGTPTTAGSVPATGLSPVTASATSAPTKLAVVGRTPTQPVGTARFALVGVLILGGLTTGTGPVLLRLAAGRPKEAIPQKKR